MKRYSALVIALLVLLSGSLTANACDDSRESSGSAGDNCTKDAPAVIVTDMSAEDCADEHPEETTEVIEDDVCAEESSDEPVMDTDECIGEEILEGATKDAEENGCVEEVPCGLADTQSVCENDVSEATDKSVVVIEEDAGAESSGESVASEDSCGDKKATEEPADTESICVDNRAEVSDEPLVIVEPSASRIDGIMICPEADMNIIRVELDVPAMVFIYDEAGNILGNSSMLYPGEDDQWAVPCEMELHTIILKDEEGKVLENALASQKTWTFRNHSPWAVFFLDAERTSLASEREEYTGIFSVACRIPKDYSDPEIVIAINEDGKMTAFREKVCPDQIYTWKKIGQTYLGDSICIICLDNGEIKKVEMKKVGFEWGVVLDTVPMDTNSIENKLAIDHMIDKAVQMD